MIKGKLLGFRQWLAENYPFDSGSEKWWYNHDDKKLIKMTGDLHHLQWAHFYSDELQFETTSRCRRCIR